MSARLHAFAISLALLLAWPPARAAAEDAQLPAPRETADGPVIRYDAMPAPGGDVASHLRLEDGPPSLRLGAEFSLLGEGAVLGEIAIAHELWRTDLRNSAVIASVAIRL
ncbi:MAG: hypothetical protein H3C38_06445 [Rhodospirillales bacterium]|nr:hypothetical protein [Rhodospirillales bacterium]